MSKVRFQLNWVLSELLGTAESDGVDFSLDLGVVSLSGKDLIGVQNLLKKHQALNRNCWPLTHASSSHTEGERHGRGG